MQASEAKPGVLKPLSFREMIVFGHRFPRKDRGFWFGFAIDFLWSWMLFTTRLRIQGMEHLPKSGGVLVASNHLSIADPATVTAFCLGGQRMPRFLAKSSLWKLPVIGMVMRSGKHIPVYRDASSPGAAYRDAVRAVRAEECVVFFPEGTLSDQPELWPMRGKTGLARVALTTGAPVIPLANWGTRALLPPKTKVPRLIPPKVVDLVAGPPVDLSDLVTNEPTREALEEATARIMAAISALLGEIRRETPPKTQ